MKLEKKAAVVSWPSLTMLGVTKTHCGTVSLPMSIARSLKLRLYRARVLLPRCSP